MTDIHIAHRLFSEKWSVFSHYTPHIFKIKTIEERNRCLDSAQNHILAPMGNAWWQPEARCSREYMKDYIQKVNDAGGVVSVDIHINEDGSFVEEQKNTLMLKYSLRKRECQ